MRPREEYRQVIAMRSEPLSDRAIERLTGVPHQTVGRWRRTYCRRHERRLMGDESWRPPEASSYAYLLGLYLGDGHVVRHTKGSAYLRLALDERYPLIVSEATDATGAVFRDSPVRKYGFGTARRVILQVSHPAVPFAFPQHGAGRKHERRIQLVPWQAELCRSQAAAFVRGLVHSDGCRTTNRVRTRSRVYEYARYFFSNESADIRGLFESHCELLGVRCTRSNRRNLSVADRASVEILDSFIGPKA